MSESFWVSVVVVAVFGIVIVLIYRWITAPVYCGQCGEIMKFDHTTHGGMMPIADALQFDDYYRCKNGHLKRV